MAEDNFAPAPTRGTQLRSSRYPGFVSRAFSTTGNVTPEAPPPEPEPEPEIGEGPILPPGDESDENELDPNATDYQEFNLGGRFPNAAALGVPSYAMRAASAIPVVGKAAGFANAVGNVVNTELNAEDLAKAGTPLSFGQRVGGYLGFNGYNGTMSRALNSKMQTPDGRVALTGNKPSTSQINSDIAASQPAFTYEAPTVAPVTTEPLGPLGGDNSSNGGPDHRGVGFDNTAEDNDFGWGAGGLGGDSNDGGDFDGGEGGWGGREAGRDQDDREGPGSSGGDDGGGDSGGDGGRVICTELVRQRLAKPEFVRLDAVFSYKHLTNTHLEGYWAWGRPYVRLMRRSDWIGRAATGFIRPLVVWRMEAVRHALGERKTRHIRGEVMRVVFEGLSYAIGWCMGVKSTAINMEKVR